MKLNLIYILNGLSFSAVKKMKIVYSIVFSLILQFSACLAGDWLNCKKEQVHNAKIDCSKYENGQNSSSKQNNNLKLVNPKNETKQIPVNPNDQK